MKKLAILLVVFLLLGGAGGAGWWFFLREQPEPDSAEAEDQDSLISLTRFIRLQPIVLPVIREGQVMLHVTAVVVVQVADPLTLEELRDFSLPLRDSVLSELHGIFAIRYVQERGYDLSVVRQRLGRAAERVLGEGQVIGVAIEDLTKRVPSTS